MNSLKHKRKTDAAALLRAGTGVGSNAPRVAARRQREVVAANSFARGLMDSIILRIADLDVTLSLAECDEATRARIADHYTAFIVPTGIAAPVIRVRVEPGGMFTPFHPSRVWQIHSTMCDGRLEFRSHFEMGWLDWNSGQGTLTMRPAGNPENFLRVIYAWRCLDDNALLLHSSGVIRNGRGYVFFGPSGSGKTTMTRLAHGHTILSDDMVIIKEHGARFRVYGVPFCGDLPEAPRTNAVADVYGVFALVKDLEHRVAALPASEAVARLSACVPFVMAQPENARRVTAICAALHAAVPARVLHFSRDDGFWEVIDELG
jgi:hypothetical protein